MAAGGEGCWGTERATIPLDWLTSAPPPIPPLAPSQPSTPLPARIRPNKLVMRSQAKTLAGHDDFVRGVIPRGGVWGPTVTLRTLDLDQSIIYLLCWLIPAKGTPTQQQQS